MPFAGDIHYRRSKGITNSKTPLLLIHGAGGSYLYWPAELRRLAGEDVLAIDLPAHGDSPGVGRESIAAYSDDVLKFLDQLNINRPVVCGHSMGAAIAIQLCLDHPDRLQGLILIGSGARYDVNPKMIQYCKNEKTYPQALHFITKFSFSAAADQRLVQLAAERLASTPAATIYRDFIACDAFDVRDRLSEIDKRTLLICGEEDKMMPLSCSQQLAEGLPKSRLEIVSGAGHMVMLEQPKTVAHLVKEFLDQVSAMYSQT